MAGIAGVIPPPAATFLAQREMLVVAASDGDGFVWTTQLTGAPGFISVADERTVHVDARPYPHDPLATTLAGGATVGTIAIDFATRRRMRLNGTSLGDAGGITIVSDQVYANCPKFIAARSVEAVAPASAVRFHAGSASTRLRVRSSRRPKRSSSAPRTMRAARTRRIAAVPPGSSRF